MRPLIRYALLIVLCLGGTRVLAAETKVGDLRCEYAINPLGLETPHPRLSWVLTSAERGEKQTAYQILAASSEEKLQAATGDVWDSGKVTSDQSIQFPYMGKPLSSRQQVYWKVRTWDKSGHVGSYSDAGKWEMGLLSPSDWQARWIGYAPAWNGGALYFRNHFTMSKPVKQARAYVAGLGYYEFRLNGERVGDRVLDPGFTTYDKRVLYATYDVTSQITQGGNAIGVIVGNGWYGAPKLIMQLEVSNADGSTKSIVTHGEFGDENYPRGYYNYYGDVKHPSYDVIDGGHMLRIHYLYRVGRVAADSDRGWFGVVNGQKNIAYIENIKYFPDQDYPDGASVESWSDGPGTISRGPFDQVLENDPAKTPYFMEGEVMSPYATLDPGEEYSFPVYWSPTRVTNPIVDSVWAGAISSPLAAEINGNQVALKGTFGVYMPGTLVAQFVTAKGEIIKQETLQAVDPREVVRVSKTLDLPGEVSRVSVFLQDSDGQNHGFLGNSVLRPR